MAPLVNQYTNAFTALTQRESSEKMDAVAVLRAFIAESSFATGDRLPPERELIVKLGMSRSILRKGLDALEREGAIWRHVGKGTFLSEQGANAASGEIGTLGQHLSPVRMIQARMCIEPSLAREAAIHASRGAITKIRRAMDASVTALNWADYETQDDLFHRLVAEATDNVLLVSLFDQLNHVRRAVAGDAVIRGTPRPPRTHSSFAEHQQIALAIQARDPDAAQMAMRKHIGSVSARLFGES